MSKLTALIGLPRSGKSTFSKKWQKETDPDGLNRVVISGDKIRLALHGQRYIHAAEPIVHGIYPVAVKALLLNEDLNVMMDDTHTSISGIKSVLTINPNAEFIYIDTSLRECLDRAEKTNQIDLNPVIHRMWNNLDDLIRRKHPDIAVRKDGLKEVITRENIMSSIEVIRCEVKEMLKYAERSV